MTNETQFELVRFEADGLEEVTEQTREFSRELTATEKRYADLARRINSPAFGRHAQQMAAVNRQYERAKQLEQQMVRKADLQSRYGNIGGALAAWGERSGATGLAARVGGIGAGAVTGLAAKGLSGSAEMALLEQRMDRLAKAIAGAAVPAVERLTSWAEKLEDATRSMSGRQQQAVAGIGGAAIAGAAVGGPRGALLAALFEGARQGGDYLGGNTAAGFLGLSVDEPGRTDVTPFNPGLHELGSAYTEAFSAGQMHKSEEAAKESATTLSGILDNMKYIRWAIERQIEGPRER